MTEWVSYLKQRAERNAPAMVIGPPSLLRNQLCDHLIALGFDPETCDDHLDAAASLRAAKLTGNLPAVIFSGYDCGEGVTAADFLDMGGHQGTPFICITRDAKQMDAFDETLPLISLPKVNLERAISRDGRQSEVGVELTMTLEQLKQHWLEAHPALPDLP
jgi:hypothetical protein